MRSSFTGRPSGYLPLTAAVSVSRRWSCKLAKLSAQTSREASRRCRPEVFRFILLTLVGEYLQGQSSGRTPHDWVAGLVLNEVEAVSDGLRWALARGVQCPSFEDAALALQMPLRPCKMAHQQYNSSEFPARVDGLFRPHYVSWSEQQKIELHAPDYLRNVIRIVTETGLRIYKELTPMKKDQLDLDNRTVWIPDSKTPNGVAEVPLTEIAADAFRRQLA